MSAPVVSVYPAAEGPRRPASGKTDPAKYDFSSGFDPAPLAEQLSHHTPVPIPYRAPINWGKIVTTAFSAAAFLLFARFFKSVLTGRLIWVIMTVVPSLAFMGGLMFVQIRASPWQMPNGQWMAQGFSNQFGKEVQMVAIICKPMGFPCFRLVLITIPRRLLGWCFPCPHPCHTLCIPCTSAGADLHLDPHHCLYLFLAAQPLQVQKPGLVQPTRFTELSLTCHPTIGYPFKLFFS
jgi:hypothetical protein